MSFSTLSPNLAMFHGPYQWSRGLIRLGQLDRGAGAASGAWSASAARRNALLNLGRMLRTRTMPRVSDKTEAGFE
jgi:hypothetical protein